MADATSDTEKKRQEVYNEVFYTERDFVRDMEYLRDVSFSPTPCFELQMLTFET